MSRFSYLNVFRFLFLFSILTSCNSKVFSSISSYSNPDSLTRNQLHLLQDTILLEPIINQPIILLDTILPPQLILIPKDTIVPKLSMVSTDTTIMIESVSKVDRRLNYKFSGSSGITLNQLQLSNWASGGESSAAGKVFSDIRIIACSRIVEYDISGKFAYGMASYKNNRIEKTDDRIDISATVTRRTIKHWTFAGVVTFKTQFANGYKYPNDSTIISGFCAPAYLNISLGYRYKKDDRFTLFLSPASGKFTFVGIQELADNGAFGVKPAIYDTAGNKIMKGKNHLVEFGINVLANFRQPLGKNIELLSTLNLYNNYLDENNKNRWNIDVDWETTINFTINKRVSTILFFHLKYDHDTKIPMYETVDGVDVKVGEGPRLQFKESLGIGLTYSFT